MIRLKLVLWPSSDSTFTVRSNPGMATAVHSVCGPLLLVLLLVCQPAAEKSDILTHKELKSSRVLKTMKNVHCNDSLWSSCGVFFFYLWSFFLWFFCSGKLQLSFDSCLDHPLPPQTHRSTVQASDCASVCLEWVNTPLRPLNERNSVRGKTQLQDFKTSLTRWCL